MGAAIVTQLKLAQKKKKKKKWQRDSSRARNARAWAS